MSVQWRTNIVLVIESAGPSVERETVLSVGGSRNGAGKRRGLAMSTVQVPLPGMCPDPNVQGRKVKNDRPLGGTYRARKCVTPRKRWVGGPGDEMYQTKVADYSGR